MRVYVVQLVDADEEGWVGDFKVVGVGASQAAAVLLAEQQQGFSESAWDTNVKSGVWTTLAHNQYDGKYMKIEPFDVYFGGPTVVDRTL